MEEAIKEISGSILLVAFREFAVHRSRLSAPPNTPNLPRHNPIVKQTRRQCRRRRLSTLNPGSPNVGPRKPGNQPSQPSNLLLRLLTQKILPLPERASAITRSSMSRSTPTSSTSPPVSTFDDDPPGGTSTRWIDYINCERPVRGSCIRPHGSIKRELISLFNAFSHRLRRPHTPWSLVVFETRNILRPR